MGDPALYSAAGSPSDASGKLHTTLLTDPTRGTSRRLAWALDPSRLGADVSGSTAAAMAAASVALNPSRPDLAAQLVAVAGRLYRQVTGATTAHRSYCRLPGASGNGSLCAISVNEAFTALAMEVPSSEAGGGSSLSSFLSGQVQCWVPAYAATTCLPRVTPGACKQQQAEGGLAFQR